jgi:hypothetical protein
MALFFEGAICPICHEAIVKPIFATSGVFLPRTDPLWAYCDACMHWPCYATWQHRERFAQAYVRMQIENEKTNQYWTRVFLDEFSFISINPDLQMRLAHVYLFRTGSRIDVPLPEWRTWMRRNQTPPTHHPLEAAAWLEALPSIRNALPIEQALYRAAARTSKEKLRADNAAHELEQLATIEIYNQGCEDLRKRLESAGLVCPHCQELTKKVRYYDEAPGARSYFVCRLCARSFRLEDFVQMP